MSQNTSPIFAPEDIRIHDFVVNHGQLMNKLISHHELGNKAFSDDDRILVPKGSVGLADLHRAVLEFIIPQEYFGNQLGVLPENCSYVYEYGKYKFVISGGFIPTYIYNFLPEKRTKGTFPFEIQDQVKAFWQHYGDNNISGINRYQPKVMNPPYNNLIYGHNEASLIQKAVDMIKNPNKRYYAIPIKTILDIYSHDLHPEALGLTLEEVYLIATSPQGNKPLRGISGLPHEQGDNLIIPANTYGLIQLDNTFSFYLRKGEGKAGQISLNIYSGLKNVPNYGYQVLSGSEKWKPGNLHEEYVTQMGKQSHGEDYQPDPWDLGWEEGQGHPDTDGIENDARISWRRFDGKFR